MIGTDLISNQGLIHQIWTHIGSIYPNSVDIVSCFCSLISKIRQIYIISAQFCGWKCALVAPINVNLTVKVEWLFRFRFRLFTNNISCYNQNISHDVTDCTFCDWKMNWSVSLAKFLSHIENITVEKTEDVKRIEIDRTDPWQNTIRKWTKEKRRKLKL